MRVRGPKIVGRAEQTDSTLLRYASASREQKKFRELLAQTFDRFQTLRRNSQQQDATGCANGRNMRHLTILEVFDQQCCVLLHGALVAYAAVIAENWSNPLQLFKSSWNSATLTN